MITMLVIGTHEEGDGEGVWRTVGRVHVGEAGKRKVKNDCE